MQHWITVEENYLNYLRKFENRIPYSDYGEDKFKPFFGELFAVGDLVYVTQISHAQPRHLKMKNSMDFYKVYIPDSTSPKGDRFVAVVNLNYMFPVNKKYISNLEYRDIGNHRTFKNAIEKSLYIDLLKKEMNAINNMNLEKKAERLYDLKNNHPENFIAKRCINFCELEKYAVAYKQ